MDKTINGILIINKPQNMTSFDVIAILRKKFGIKRMGHLGTLDPMATGVLPVAIGSATRVMDYLDMDMKEYIAEIKLGITSDTDDIWGNIIEHNPNVPIVSSKINNDNINNNKNNINNKSIDINGIDITRIETAIKKQIGLIDQLPPDYAAIKIDGKKLYEYARSGKSEELENKKKARKVYIESIDILNGLPTLVLKIKCSKGTYIRSIARDIGIELGVGAVMSGLVRTKSGVFDLDDAMDLADVIDFENIDEQLISADSALGSFPSLVLGNWEAKLFSNGVKLRRDQWDNPGNNPDDKGVERTFGSKLIIPEKYNRLYRVYGEDNKENFIGMGIEIEDGMLKADKVFR